jgi:hypothetical protein
LAAFESGAAASDPEIWRLSSSNDEKGIPQCDMIFHKELDADMIYGHEDSALRKT